jgi:hypothetical protein
MSFGRHSGYLLGTRIPVFGRGWVLWTLTIYLPSRAGTQNFPQTSWPRVGTQGLLVTILSQGCLVNPFFFFFSGADMRRPVHKVHLLSSGLATQLFLKKFTFLGPTCVAPCTKCTLVCQRLAITFRCPVVLPPSFKQNLLLYKKIHFQIW